MTLHYYSLHLQQHELDEEKEEEEEEEEKMNTPHPLPQRLLHGISSILVASTAKIVLRIAPFLLPVEKQNSELEKMHKSAKSPNSVKESTFYTLKPPIESSLASRARKQITYLNGVSGNPKTSNPTNSKPYNFSKGELQTCMHVMGGWVHPVLGG
jgi:hypothetical protein